MDLFHALAFEVLKKNLSHSTLLFFVCLFFLFPPKEEREAINAGVSGVGVFGFFLFAANSFCMNTIYHMPFYYFSNTTFVPKMLMLCICLWIVYFFNLLKLQLVHYASSFSILLNAWTVSLCQIWHFPSHLVKVIYKPKYQSLGYTELVFSALYLFYLI